MSSRAKFFMVGSLLAAVAGGVLVSAPDANAHKGAKGIVKQRMDMMKSIGASMKSIKKMLQGEVAYDAAKVREAAGVIKKHAGEPMVKLFPKGSMQKPTEATAQIWEDWDGFKAISMRLRDYAGALEQSADRNSGMAEASGMAATLMSSDIAEGGWPSASELAQMPPQATFMAITKTCKSCHQSFRKKKEEGHAH